MLIIYACFRLARHHCVLASSLTISVDLYILVNYEVTNYAISYVMTTELWSNNLFFFAIQCSLFICICIILTQKSQMDNYFKTCNFCFPNNPFLAIRKIFEIFDSYTHSLAYLPNQVMRCLCIQPSTLPHITPPLP